jgi:hypothetical protein
MKNFIEKLLFVINVILFICLMVFGLFGLINRMLSPARARQLLQDSIVPLSYNQVIAIGTLCLVAAFSLYFARRKWFETAEQKEIRTKNACRACEFYLEDKSSLETCPVCMANVKSPDKLKDKTLCSWIKPVFGFDISVDVNLHLTNKRLILFTISRYNPVMLKIPVIGGDVAKNVVQRVTKRKKVIFVSIPLSEISSVEHCKYSFREGIVVHTHSGDAYRFFGFLSGKKLRTWKGYIKK